MDTIHMVMGVDAPRSAVAVGGQYGEGASASEMPDTLNVLWEYPGWTLEYAIREASAYTGDLSYYGIVFHGTDAALFLDRSGYQIIPEGDCEARRTFGTPGEDNFMPELLTRAHVRNFLDCMATRERPVADVEIGHRSTTVPHLGNISYHLGRKVNWDARRERFVDDPEADARLGRSYREPYVLPEV
jgi:hypothetical protein